MVREAARRYRWRVEDAAVEAAGEARRMLRRLARDLARGELDSSAVQISDRLLDLRVWEEVTGNPALRALLLNQYCLGLGDVRAPVIVMGTEAADDLTKPLELAYQGILPLVLLAHERAEVADPLLQLGNWSRPAARWPVHLAPWDYFGTPSAGRNTWRLVSEVVSRRPYLDLIGPERQDLGLGTRAYQIECSAASARKARDGMPPSAERVAFLADAFLPAVASTARVLLMHGFGSPWPIWKERSDQIAKSFLGFDPKMRWERRPDKSYLEVRRTEDGRALIWSRALNFDVPGELIDEIRETVLAAAPETG
jgi:hypothetical protein